MSKGENPFPYLAMSPVEKKNKSQQSLDAAVQQRIYMERKYERLQLIFHILKHRFGAVPEELAMTIHMLTYDDLLELLDDILNANSLDEVFDTLI